MKRVFTILLLFCFVAGAIASADDVPRNSFLLKVWNASNLDISYLRFDLYLDEFEPGKTTYVANVCSTPKDGEDFYRCELYAPYPERMNYLRIEVSYGRSDLSPDVAIAQCAKGDPVEEHHLLTLDFTPRLGHCYDLELVGEGDGWMLVPVV